MLDQPPERFRGVGAILRGRNGGDRAGRLRIIVPPNDVVRIFFLPPFRRVESDARKQKRVRIRRKDRAAYGIDRRKIGRFARRWPGGRNGKSNQIHPGVRRQCDLMGEEVRTVLTSEKNIGISRSIERQTQLVLLR